jgi:hypothetical protein
MGYVPENNNPVLRVWVQKARGAENEVRGSKE